MPPQIARVILFVAALVLAAPAVASDEAELYVLVGDQEVEFEADEFLKFASKHGDGKRVRLDALITQAVNDRHAVLSKVILVSPETSLYLADAELGAMNGWWVTAADEFSLIPESEAARALLQHRSGRDRIVHLQKIHVFETHPAH